MQQLTPLEYLKIDASNHWGNDKLLWDERLEWFEANVNQLDSMADSADSPILYRKAVRAYREVMAGNPTGHMVSLDATWSGGQLMAVLYRCEKTAEASNLIPTGTRVDIYTLVRDYMNTNFNMNITRQDMKDCFMPRYYSSVATAIDLFGKGTPEHIAFLETCKERVPGAERCLKNVNRTWNSNVTHHSWKLPDGHTAYVPVMDKEKKRISMGKTSFTHIISVNKPVKRGLANAANFIQSLDGYVVREMIRKAKKQGYELVTIHDSFWCSPLWMQKTRENYLEIMLDMAQKPIAVTWHNSMQNTAHKEIHSQEEIDSFCDKLKEAEYFLS